MQNVGGGAGEFGDLPEWDLSDLYTAEDAPELIRDLAWLEEECANFAKDYEGKLAELDAAGFLACVLRNEKINGIAGRIMSYAGLRYYQLTDGRGAREVSLGYAGKDHHVHHAARVFFTLELNRSGGWCARRALC
jgi:oligoendopeptidase F